MIKISYNLEKLGFDKWFQYNAVPESLEGLEIARVIAVHKDSYTITNGKNDVFAELVGKIIYSASSSFKTKTVREKDSKGRHATTYRQLITLDCGAMVVDTPGMRELGNFSVETGLNETFAEITELSRKCQFNDCTHTTEKGCAVLNAVEDGKLSEKRYQNYIKMNKESIYNEMSYLEKRQKDKQFGKFCKTVMKHKKKQKT